jgi:hypothetical protein
MLNHADGYSSPVGYVDGFNHPQVFNSLSFVFLLPISHVLNIPTSIIHLQLNFYASHSIEQTQPRRAICLRR